MKRYSDLYENILYNLHEAVYFVDRDRRINFWNKEAEVLTGYGVAEVLGRHCFDSILMHVDGKGMRLCEVGCPLLETIKDGRLREAEVFFQHRDGHRLPTTVRISPVRNDDGEIIGAAEVFSDNSENLKALQQIGELHDMARIDKLTGIGNRRFSEDSLGERFHEFRRYGWSFGVLFFDIDHFKQVNDTVGHEVGDEVLKVVARTLAKNVRSFDFVGRWGGEEFIVIIVKLNEEQLWVVGQKLRNLVQQSGGGIGTAAITVTISGGATMVRTDDTIETLMKRADQLLYKSKSEGRNRLSLG